MTRFSWSLVGLGVFLFLFFSMFFAYVHSSPDRIAAGEAAQQAQIRKQQEYYTFLKEREKYKPYEDASELVAAFKDENNYVKLVKLQHKQKSYIELGTTFLAGTAIRNNRVLVPYVESRINDVAYNESMDKLFSDYAWLGKDGRLHVFGKIK